MANEQLPTSNSPTLVSDSSSAVQTESESSDGGSDGDDDKPIEQSSSESVQSADESEQQSNTSDDDDDDKDDESEIKGTNEIGDDSSAGGDIIDDQQTELVSNAAAQDNDDKASIDLDEIRYKNLKILYEGRDILDFSTNVVNKSWNVKYAHLPEQNYQMYIQNRSQYNRLAPGYESPEHYALNACGRCAFQFPVMVDIPEEDDKIATSACKSNVNDLLTQTVATIVNALAQKLPAAQPMAAQSSMHTPTGQSMNNLNNFMLNNGASSSAQSYAYQNRNQFNNANVAAAAAAAANNHSCFKQNNNSNGNNTNNNNNANAFYGNNMMLNALVNQIGNMNNSSGFNSSFMNAINGTNTTNQLNQLSNAALANLMNQQNQNQNRQQLYGMCRQNINKSGINFNANSHKQMPTYSHF